MAPDAETITVFIDPDEEYRLERADYDDGEDADPE